MVVNINADFVASDSGESLLIGQIPATVTTDHHVVLQEVTQSLRVTQQGGQCSCGDLVECGISGSKHGEGAWKNNIISNVRSTFPTSVLPFHFSVTSGKCNGNVPKHEPSRPSRIIIISHFIVHLIFF